MNKFYPEKIFVEEEVEERGGHLHDCRTGFCTHFNGDEKSCKGRRECYWYPPLRKHKAGMCSPCAGVNCGTHRAPSCRGCLHYDGKDKKKYCNGGDCKWNHESGYAGGTCFPK